MAVKDLKLTNLIYSVGFKLFSIIFVSIIACVVTVGLLAYGEAKKLVERNMSDASFQTINQVANNLDVVYKTYADTSLQIIVDKDVNSLLDELAEAKDEYTRLQTMRQLSDKLNSYIIGNVSITSAALIPVNDGGQLITAGASGIAAVSSIIESEWFQQTVEMDGRINWIEPQTSGLVTQGGFTTVGAGRLIKNSHAPEKSYVLLMEIPIGNLIDNYSDVDLGKGSELDIVNSEGNYVISKDPSLIGSPASVTLPSGPDEDDRGSLKMKKSDGAEVLTVYKTFKNMDWKLVGTIPVEELVEDAKVILTLTQITAAIAILLAIAIGVLVIYMIARPLAGLRNLMLDGARGNLTIRSTMRKRRDEIGQLGDSFNGMMTQIEALAVQTTYSAADVLSTATELTEASKKTAIAAQEIAVATEEIANGATSLAVEAEKGSDLTGNITSQIKNVIEENQEMVRSAGDVEKASEQGTTYMNILIEKTGMTEEMTRSMVEKVDALKESTGSIVKILDVLNNLMKQTNILSLNATIEAARAGAAGKGFMVVADEIRKLADQSRHSIEIVAQITEKIQHEIDETVQVLSDAYPLFKEQISSVKEANQIFLSVQGQMTQFVERLELVTGSIHELDQSQVALADAMTNVSAVAEESSATSEEVASLSSEQLSISDSLVRLSDKLDSVSRGLKDSLSKFKIQ